VLCCFMHLVPSELASESSQQLVLAAMGLAHPLHDFMLFGIWQMRTVQAVMHALHARCCPAHASRLHMNGEVSLLCRLT